ncbi:MAG TPA: hypothetical protein VEJ67_12775 [Candidatus Cybelea sp.]|nr:hypothetical protein [Candidatus Cybelea sp.]
MSADPSRVELLVSRDARLIAAVEAVVAHASGRAGLSPQEQAELRMATEGACDMTFSRAARNGTRNPLLRIVVSDFPGRVEVSIEESCGSPSSAAHGGSASFPTAQPESGRTALEEVNIDLEGGQVRTVLVKHRSTANPRPHR